MSIKDLIDKIKGSHHFPVFLTVVIIIASSTASFGLGRLSASNSSDEGVLYFPADRSQAAAGLQTVSAPEEKGVQPSIPSGGALVASKNGSRYYFPWCSGAKQIKEENKVWFTNKEEAEAAGFTPALNCKGL